LDGELLAVVNLFEGHLNLLDDGFNARLLLLPLLAAHLTKDITEGVTATTSTCALLECVFASFVVHIALLAVAEDTVCFRDFLELLLVATLIGMFGSSF